MHLKQTISQQLNQHEKNQTLLDQRDTWLDNEILYNPDNLDKSVFPPSAYQPSQPSNNEIDSSQAINNNRLSKNSKQRKANEFSTQKNKISESCRNDKSKTSVDPENGNNGSGFKNTSSRRSPLLDGGSPIDDDETLQVSKNSTSGIN